MATTDISTPVPYREVTDANGRVYRIGESDVDIMGRKRKWMVILPWVGMMGISSAEYAFASAEETLHTAHQWSNQHIFWMLGVWVFFQAAVAFPAGKLRESGKLPARWAMMLVLWAPCWVICRSRSRRTWWWRTSVSACSAVWARAWCTRRA